MSMLPPPTEEEARIYEARRKFAQAFLRANLQASRAIARNAKITMDFENDGFDPLKTPVTYDNGAAIIAMPYQVNMRSPHLWPQIRLMSDTAAAWIEKSADDDLLRPHVYEGDQKHDLVRLKREHHAIIALEKARRESLMFERLEGARNNFIRHFSLKDRVDGTVRVTGHRDPYWTNNATLLNIVDTDIRNEIIGEGFYVAALCALMPDLARKRPDIALIANLWQTRIKSASSYSFSNLEHHRGDAEQYAANAGVIVNDFYTKLDHNLRPLNREARRAAGLASGTKKEDRAWTGKNLLEVHEQLVTHRLIRPPSVRHSFPREPRNHSDGKYYYSTGGTNSSTLGESLPDLVRLAQKSGGAALYTPEKESADESAKATIAQPKWFKLPKAFLQEERPDDKTLLKEFASSLTPELQALFLTSGFTSKTEKEEYPKGQEPVWIKLADIFEDSFLPPDDLKSLPPLVTGLDWRRDNYLASYKRLRKENEEIVTVADLVPDKEQLEKDWLKLQKAHPALARTARELARKFDAWLRTQSGTRAQFESEEGRLDLSRLVNLITDPGFTNAYIGETPDQQADTVITLLFDFSGSMSGHEIITAMLMAHALSTALERNKIANEVLGFTTSNSRTSTGDGKSEYVKKSRHIIVKAANQKLRQCSANFGIASHSEHMGGTNDTDAVLWAASRLLARPEKRKILIVASDVQPNASFIKVDYPDLSYEGLLKSVTTHVNLMKDIEVAGVGIGQHHTLASDYYPNGVNIFGIEDLGPSLARHLQKLLDPTHMPSRQLRVRAPAPEPKEL